MVRSGRRLSDELISRIGVSDTAASLIGHGESSGSLAASLASARALLERQDELRRSCLSALAYPSMIGLASCGLVVGLVRGVMPQIVPMLESLHVPLPLLTRIVMCISDIAQAYGIYIAISCAASVAIALAAYRRSLSVRHIIQMILLKTPIIGMSVRRYAMSVFLRSCGSLIGSGLSSVEAFSSVARTVALQPVRLRLERQSAEVRRGVPLGIALERAGFPKDVSGLAQAGEMSGSLGASLVRSADIMDRDMSHMLKRLTSLIEPMMMLFMGGIVGAIALSIMMPIYDVSRILQK